MLELSDDRGVISVLTAIVGSVVLLASAAMAIDVATLYSERRQLQNGADAAAIAVAQSCARGLANAAAPCDIGPASALANGNALDHRSRVALICGTAPGLADCPAAGGSRASCPAPAAGSPPYVEVHVRTGTADGADVVSPVFVRVLPGFQDYPGTTVGACARAGYGAPATALSVLPITVSQCVVNQYRTEHGTFAPSTLADAAPSQLRHWETAIELHQDSGPCATSSSGLTAPGNFGYLETATCAVETTAGASVPGDTGSSNPKTLGCTDSYLSSRLGEVVYLPVFDTVTGSGDSTRYHLVGYAALIFTGWQLSGTSHVSIATGAAPCGPPVTCISGAFVYGLQPTPGPISSAPSYGATAVQLLG